MKKSTLTVKQALAVYLASEKIRLKASTYAIYVRYIKNHITPALGKFAAADLTKERIQNFAAKLLSDNGLSVSTAKSVVSFLRCGLSESVPAGVFKVKFPKEEQKITAVFSQKQQKILEETAKKEGEAIYLAVVLCLYLGLRIGEVCALKWADFDWENRCVHIKRTVQRISNPDSKGKKTKIIFQTPKSYTSFRTIPIPKFLVGLLKNAQRDGEFVVSKDGSFIEPRTVQNRFKKVLKEAGLDNHNFHILRHTFATRALETGFDPKTLSEVMGHSNPTITMSRYAHCLNEHKRKAMNRLFEIWQGGKNRQGRRLLA